MRGIHCYLPTIWIHSYEMIGIDILSTCYLIDIYIGYTVHGERDIHAINSTRGQHGDLNYTTHRGLTVCEPRRSCLLLVLLPTCYPTYFFPAEVIKSSYWSAWRLLSCNLSVISSEEWEFIAIDKLKQCVIRKLYCWAYENISPILHIPIINTYYQPDPYTKRDLI